MKTIKLTLLTFAILAFTTNSFSQYEENNKAKEEYKNKSKHAVGLAAGFSTGYGLSYQYTPNKITFQLAFAPLKDDNMTLISTGLTFIYRIKEGDKLNFFVYQANHYIVDRETRTNYPYPPGTPSTSTINNDRFNNGIGLGFEFFIGENVLFDLMTGYGARNNFKELGLTGEIGLFYKL
ncbi:MAG: hypothetical protein QMC21_05860 [Flavobacteriales bacterium]|jgi:hypothetical protein|tara:strand:+ start:5123 stop:5659 length:537 start_codon:yes stop_codon:yes gene_type:complete